ncbi:MAG: tetratricopeptide repeat protein [Chthoniobacterales bacterium]
MKLKRVLIFLSVCVLWPIGALRAEEGHFYDNVGQGGGRRQPWRSLAGAGSGALQKKDYARAIRFLDAALATNPDPKGAAEIWELRADAYAASGEKSKTRVDYERALSVASKDTTDHLVRAHLYKKMENYRAAAAQFAKAADLAPEDAGAWNDLAWFRATAPGGEGRDGKEAVRAATKACEMTNWKKNSCRMAERSASNAPPGSELKADNGR